MRLRIFVKSWEHNGQDYRCIVANQAHNILVVPIVKGTFSHLEVRAGNAARQLSKKGYHNLWKLSWLHYIQNFLQLIQEHHLKIKKVSFVLHSTKNGHMKPPWANELWAKTSKDSEQQALSATDPFPKTVQRNRPVEGDKQIATWPCAVAWALWGGRPCAPPLKEVRSR